ncbi:ABC transporter-like protein [Flammeovirgaceae bacterium 311]|nr:ABC transporter-like protein [Flammeovirgaceae bacterium 311]
MKAVLEAHNLSIGYRYRQETLVRAGIELALEPGRLVCLMGPNGAGKSTLLRTLAGVQLPLGGELLLQGVPIEKLSQQEKARAISLVLTDPVHSANLRVLEVVQLGRYPHTGWFGSMGEVDRKAVEKALDDTETRHLADRKLYTLSDGQRQKVLIARAMAQGGQLLLLDEPTAHLDLVHRIQIMHLLRGVAQEQQKAVVVATHELDLALQTADRLLLMPHNAGDPMLEGMPEDLVLNGSLEQAFSREPFKFDVQTGRFYQPLPQKASVLLRGPEPARYWTEQVLRRHGIVVAGSPVTTGAVATSASAADAAAADAIATIEVQQKAVGWMWHYQHGLFEQQFFSLAGLLKELCKRY